MAERGEGLMSNLGTIRKRAETLGASIDETDCSWDLWAPDGQVWASSGDRVITVNFASPWGETWKRDAARDALAQMEKGLAPDA
jgi:hypothetical protein